MGMEKRRQRLEEERTHSEKDRKIKTYLFRTFVYLFAIAMTFAMYTEYTKEPSTELPKFVMECDNGSDEIFDNDSLFVCGKSNPLHTHTELRIDDDLFNITHEHFNK